MKCNSNPTSGCGDASIVAEIKIQTNSLVVHLDELKASIEALQASNEECCDRTNENLDSIETKLDTLITETSDCCEANTILFGQMISLLQRLVDCNCGTTTTTTSTTVNPCPPCVTTTTTIAEGPTTTTTTCDGCTTTTTTAGSTTTTTTATPTTTTSTTADPYYHYIANYYICNTGCASPEELGVIVKSLVELNVQSFYTDSIGGGFYRITDTTTEDGIEITTGTEYGSCPDIYADLCAPQ